MSREKCAVCGDELTGMNTVSVLKRGRIVLVPLTVTYESGDGNDDELAREFEETTEALVKEGYEWGEAGIECVVPV